MSDILDEELRKALTPTFDWSGIDEKEEKRILRDSRYRWEYLYDLLDVKTDHEHGGSSSFKFAIMEVSKRTDDVIKALLIYAQDLDRGVSHSDTFLNWIKNSDILYIFVLMVYVRDYFQKNIAGSERVTAIDLFDIEVTIDVLAKMIEVGVDQNIPAVNSIYSQMRIVSSAFSELSPETWELFFQESQ